MNRNIPFKQFIEKYNFCDFDINNKDDTQIIRIQLCDVFDEHNTLDYDDTWFEFGINNFDDKKNKMIEKIFSKEILDSYISSMRVFENGTLHVNLTKNEVEVEDE